MTCSSHGEYISLNSTNQKPEIYHKIFISQKIMLLLHYQHCEVKINRMSIMLFIHEWMVTFKLLQHDKKNKLWTVKLGYCRKGWLQEKISKQNWIIMILKVFVWLFQSKLNWEIMFLMRDLHSLCQESKEKKWVKSIFSIRNIFQSILKTNLPLL